MIDWIFWGLKGYEKLGTRSKFSSGLEGWSCSMRPSELYFTMICISINKSFMLMRIYQASHWKKHISSEGDQSVGGGVGDWLVVAVVRSRCAFPRVVCFTRNSRKHCIQIAWGEATLMCNPYVWFYLKLKLPLVPAKAVPRKPQKDGLICATAFLAACISILFLLQIVNAALFCGSVASFNCTLKTLRQGSNILLMHWPRSHGLNCAQIAGSVSLCGKLRLVGTKKIIVFIRFLCFQFAIWSAWWPHATLLKTIPIAFFSGKECET